MSDGPSKFVLDAEGDTAAIVPPKDEDLYPGVEHAYAFVLPSYQLLVGRFEAADNRLTAFLTLASTLTLAAPVFAKSIRPEISFRSMWFVIGVSCFLAATVVGIAGRLYGGLVLPDPNLLYDKTLHLNAWKFKRHAIDFAGRHFQRNVRAVRVKGNLSILISVLLALEISAFLLWFVR
jgi:hypothetical protein